MLSGKWIAAGGGDVVEFEEEVDVEVDDVDVPVDEDGVEVVVVLTPGRLAVVGLGWLGRLVQPDDISANPHAKKTVTRRMRR